MASTLKRDPSIDLMRFIGLTLIILAHLYMPKEWVLFQFRTFDVPLMIFTSGLAFSGKNTGAYIPFIFKRTLRLIIPVYIFVSLYMLFCPFLHEHGWLKDFNMEIVKGTYALRLNPSIGYVWIIRIFLMVMLVTPLLIKIEKKVTNRFAFYGILACMLAIQVGLRIWSKGFRSESQLTNILVKDWVAYIFGYSSIFLMGLRFRKCEWKEKLAVIVVLAAAMGAMALLMESPNGNRFFFMNDFKYPPHAYFLVWGALISCILWATAKWWTFVLNNSLFVFIGQNTIWIYLWHIPFVNIFLYGPLDGYPYPVRYICIYAASVAIYAIQYNIVKAIERKWPKNPVTRYFVG
ncbi:MAG: acyltransferase [Bacteroidales bacterium]|nr:acyltransferase [Bacteroidales bacterium]